MKVGEDDDNDEFMTLPLRDYRIWRVLNPCDEYMSGESKGK